MNFGLIFTTLNDEITGATNKLAIFGKTFSQIRLDFKNGYGLKSLFKSPINETDLQQLKNYSFHLLHGTKSTEDFTDALSHCSTSKQLLGKKVLKLKADVDQGKMSKREYANEINNLTTKERTATVATQLLGSALKVAFNVAIGIAISAIVNAIQDYAEAEQKALDKIKDTIDELKNEKDSLNDLKKKYIEIIDSSSDLSKKTEDLVGWKEELSKKYNLEADALDKVNEKRETGIALLEAEIQKTRERWYIDNKEDIEKYVDMLEARRQYTGANGDNPSAVNSRLNTIEISLTGDEKIEDLVRSDFLDLLGQVKQDLRHNERYTLSFDDVLNPSTTYEYYHKLEDILNKASEIGVANLTEQEQALVERAKAAQKNIIEQFKTFYHLEDDGVKTMFNTYDTYLEYLLGGQARDIINDYISQQGKSLSDVNSDNFVSWREELADLAKEDEKLKAILLEYANTTFPSFYKAEQQAVIAASNEEQSVTSLVETLTNLGSAYDDAQKNHAVIQSAFDKVREGTSLTADEVNKLITLCQNDFPLIGRLFTKTADGYTIAAEDLIEANDAIMQSTKDTLNAQIEQLQKTVDINTELAHKLFDENNYVGMAEAQDLAQEAYDQIQVLKLLLEMLDLVYTPKKSSGSSNDATKEAFEKDMKDIEHLHNMGLKSNKEYYDALEAANEKHYKNSAEHESDYLSNVEKIYKGRQSLYKDNADKQFDDLEDQRKRGIITAEQYAQGLHDLGQELYGEDSIYGGTEFAIKALEELDKKVKETSDDIYDEFKEGLSADGDKTLFNVLSDAEELWNKTNDLFDGDLTSIKSNAKDIFGTVSSALEDALKKDIITVDGYESLLRSWANTLQVTEADITEALVDTYEYRADALQKVNDGSLASERKYIADMKSLNFSTYSDENSDFYDPTTYASNLRDITDHQLDVLEKALNNGEISVQEYANSVVEIFKDADVLGADYVSEKLDDIDKVRAEREKTYWEQQKELMEDYYDKQIKEIEDTQKAKEKENKLEELHLKLIKARQTLEEAKNNRNQLVFHDGTFEYVADQDAVMSAEEEVANTLKEIEDEKLQAQIDLLEEQKDAALGFYDQILDEIDFYLNKTLPLSESDQEELAKIRNSDYAQYARDKRNGNLTANSDNEKIAEDALNQTDIAEETKQSVSDIAKNVLDIAKVVANCFSFENLVRALGGNPTAEAVKNFQDGYNATLVGKQITPTTLPSTTTNNSTTNNSSKTVHIDKLEVNVDLTIESLDDFVNNKIDDNMRKFTSAIRQSAARAIMEL